MKKGLYYNEEIDDKAIFGSYLIIAAGAGLILGAWLPWAHFLNDGQGWVYGLDGVGKYTALIALPLIAAGIYRMKSPARAAGIAAIILGMLATGIGISKLIDPKSIVEDTYYAEFSVSEGLYLTVLAGLIGIAGGVVKALLAKVK